MHLHNQVMFHPSTLADRVTQTAMPETSPAPLPSIAPALEYVGDFGEALSFCWLRFLLGVAEAGFFPGIVLYLTYWIPSKRRASVLAAFLTATAVSGIIGNPLAGALMKMEGVLNLRGWQWLFLLEGIAPVLMGAATLLLLPNRPRDAHWLAPSDREWLERELAR